MNKTRDEIIDDIELIQDKIDKMGFKGSNEMELWTREMIADYIVNNNIVLGDVSKCICKQRRVSTRDVEENYCTNCYETV